MSRSEFDAYLGFVAILSGAFAVVSLLRVRRRGVRSLLLAGAFALFAVALWLYRAGAAAAIVYGLGLGVVALLLADVAMRASGRGAPD